MPRAMLSKVPAITGFFWLIKVMSTTLGETAADWLDSTFKLGLTKTTLVCSVALVLVLIWQMRTVHYTPTAYWSTVILVSITGTLITDNVTDNFHVSLYASSGVFAVLLTLVFWLWWRQEHTLDITSINTVRREPWYWLAILVTFALGTAVGDLITEQWALGYAPGFALFAVALGVCWILGRSGHAQVALFWVAYVLTRPLGACLGDALTAPTKPNEDYDFTGFGLPRYGVNGVFLVVVVLVVAYLSRTHRDRLVEQRKDVPSTVKNAAH